MTRLFTASILFAASVGLAVGGTQDFSPLPQDKAFIDLAHRAIDISHGLADWNSQCAGEPGTDECQAAKKIVNAAQVEWITDAMQYHSQGDDCKSHIRTQLIKHTIRLYAWNLACMGRSRNDSHFDVCVQESEEIDQETAALQKALEDCKAKDAPKL